MREEVQDLEGRFFDLSIDMLCTGRTRAEEERERLLRELQDALAEVKELREILPICMYCKRIRDDENTRFSRSICPTCHQQVVEPQFGDSKG